MCASEAAPSSIGATTKQHVVENDPLIRAKLPLLAKVMPYVGHGATRARGTVGGSLANGDRGGRDRAGGGDARRDADLARGRRGS